MKKINTIKKNDEFTFVIKNGIYYRNKYFSLYKHTNSLNVYRFGISVGKKNGKAIIRNKIKRQLRTIIDKYKNYYSNNEDYIIIVKKDYDINSFGDIEKNFYESLEKINRKRKVYEKEKK